MFGNNNGIIKDSVDHMVSNPPHYKTSSGLEAIDVIEAFTQGMEGIEATDAGNIIKYALRWKKKNGIQDLEKLVWYTNHLINYLKSIDADSKKRDYYNIGDLYFNSLSKAEHALWVMRDNIFRLGFISIRELYDSCGFVLTNLDNHYADDYGWTIINADILLATVNNQTRYVLKLPKVVLLNNN